MLITNREYGVNTKGSRVIIQTGSMVLKQTGSIVLIQLWGMIYFVYTAL